MTDANKILVILTPGFASDEADTTCLPFLQQHILAIRNAFPKLEIVVLAFQYPYKKGYYKWMGTDVCSFDGRERPRLNRAKVWLQVWRELSRIHKNKQVVGLLSLWCTECALLGSYFGKMNGITHLNWLCGQDAKRGNKYVKLIRPKTTELIAMSDFLKREFSGNYGVDPAFVIPIGVSPSVFQELQNVRDIDVLGVGSLIPLKQYELFVQAIAALLPLPLAFKAIICGKGPEQKKLQRLIEELQVENIVSLAGEIPHEDILQLMRRTKIFLHTSNYEGFGTVCLEALAAGAHVVSFTRPMDATISHWHHVADLPEMIDCVKALLNNTSLSHTSVVPYTSDSVAKEMMKLFSL